jgi:magnesium chelatase family protein
MCQCPSIVRRRYQARLSGPLMDRVDLQVDLDPVRSAALLDTEHVEPSAVVAERVLHARGAARERWGGSAKTNGDVPPAVLRDKKHRLSRTVVRPLTIEMDRGRLSARGFERSVRVAWTITDLDGRERPGVDDVREALELRSRSVR